MKWHAQHQRTAFQGVLPILIAVTASIQLPLAADAEDFHIKNGDVTSLIAAINAANEADDADVIHLAKRGHYVLTTEYADATGLPPITSPITIDGNDAAIYRDGSPATPEFRIFYVRRGGNLGLDHVTVTNGATFFGGGIYVDGILSLVNGTSIANNRGGDGGGIFVQLGIVEIRDSVVSGNVAFYGGGILADNGATTEIIASRITDNRAIQPPGPVSGGWGGGIANMRFGGGFPDFGTSLVIRDSMIDHNSAVQGGAIYDNTGKAVVFNSTIANNTATSSNGGAIAKVGDASLGARHNCIVGNSNIALVGDGTVPDVTADYNWWGAADGPSGFGGGSGDSVNSHVSFGPFLRSPAAAQCQPLQDGDHKEKKEK